MNEASSSELVRRPHALVLPTGAARSTSELVFDSAPLVWDDLPASTRHAARHRTPVIAERAVADGSLYRDGTGARVEVMRAWRAHRDRLYVAVASRRAPAPGVLAEGSGRLPQRPRVAVRTTHRLGFDAACSSDPRLARGG